MSGNEAAWRLPEDMGAAELLRKLAGDLLLGDAALYDYLGYGHEGFWGAEKGGVSICRTLESLADMVERELLLVELCGLLGIPPMGLIDASKQEHYSKDVSMLAYDLLPDEDRDAIAWVREHGGVDAVRRDFQDADNQRVELCASLDIDLETGWADAMVAMRHRLMPEGMEWPKVDGKPVDFKTAYVPSLGVLEAVSIYNTGACQVMSHDGIIKSAKDIHIVKPKVLDADGEEIRVGDTVYHVKDGSEMTVYGIEGEWLVVSVGGRVRHDVVTHRAPVLAADGKPLREGQTVYHVKTGQEYVVVEPSYGKTVVVRLAKYDDAEGEQHAPDQLTHERPDSWARLEEDAGKNPFDYCKDVGHRLDTCENSEAYKARDLVRRAKKLAGVER